ncbi:MAG: sulfate/thiosulfate transport system permease protein [Solirubrobacteraceae bacterium]|nr:sulfate/thiosulfate transport system permease protein [Solirubrobacteraceae bacterium]
MSPLPSDALSGVGPGRVRAPSRSAHGPLPWGSAAAGAAAVAWLTLIVLVPLVAVLVKSFDGGLDTFWTSVANRRAVSALGLTVVSSAIVALVDAVMGTLIAWVLVRDRFRGKGLINALIDLPFALPTIVAGLTLLALYGPTGPTGIDIGFTRTAIVLALLFVTLPFVVRSVQPVLIGLDREVEEAAASLGANELTIFRRVILPSLRPAILSGVGLAFGRALGEFGAVVLISGNLPFKTETAAVFVFGQLESDNTIGAAAMSVVLMAASLIILLGISAFRREER